MSVKAAWLPTFVAVTALLLALPGCAGKGLLNWNRNAIPKATARNPVVEAVGIWTVAEGTGLDGLPTRGMAGQILFFTHGSSAPVQADGDVRIYLFDDQGTREEQGKPLHQFDFLGDAWTSLLKVSALGPSYHVFIPYTRKQPYQTQCALRIRLKPTHGPPVYSEMTHITLPGPLRERNPDGAPRLTSGTSLESGTAGAAERRLDVATLRGPAAKAAASRVMQAAGFEELPVDAQDERMRRVEQMLEQLIESRAEMAQRIKDRAAAADQNPQSQPQDRKSAPEPRGLQRLGAESAPAVQQHGPEPRRLAPAAAAWAESPAKPRQFHLARLQAAKANDEPRELPSWMQETGQPIPDQTLAPATRHILEDW